MKTEVRQRMYDNPILELLSISGPKMMVTFHLLLIGSTISYGYSITGEKIEILFIILTFIAGMILWSFAEYMLHKHLFHFESNNKFLKAFHFAMHGYHHEHPNDINRLFMPPIPALIFLSVFFLIFYLIIGNYAWYFHPGFELGYLIYSFIHYSIHKKESSRKLEKLRHHHILHHYKTPDKAYGVSSRTWDRIFRTMPQQNFEKKQ